MPAHALDAERPEAAPPPPVTAPAGPRRIRTAGHWPQIRRAGVALLGSLAVALLAAISQPGTGLPPALHLPQSASAVPARDLLLPLLMAGVVLAALWRLGAWSLPLLMAGLLAGSGLPLLLLHQARPEDVLVTLPVLTALAMPLIALLMHRAVMARVGLGDRLAGWRDGLGFGLWAGVVVPAAAATLAFGVQHALGVPLVHAASGAADLALAWALGLLSGGTALQTTSPRAHGQRWLAVAFAALALLAQLAVCVLPGPGAWWLLPHLLLCLHAAQAAPRHNAWLGAALLLVWAEGAPASTTSTLLGVGLAVLPLILLGLHQRREREGWRQALDAQGLALAEWRFPGLSQRASSRWLTLTAAPGDVVPTLPGSPLDWVRLAHPRDRDGLRRALRGLLTEPDADRICLQLRLAPDGGDWRWHELNAHVLQRSGKGQARHLIMTLADVSWRHTADERERMTAALFQHVDQGLAVLDLQWRIVEVNPAYAALLREPRDTLIGRPASPLSTANLRGNGHDPAVVQARLTAGQSWSGHLQLDREDGGRHTLSVKLSPVPEPNGTNPRWRVLSLTDQSETLRQQDLLRRTLRYDTATGLPNRDEFMRLLHQAMPEAMREGFKLVVCLIDLDDFAHVNAEHGQLVADAVLLQLSSRLQSALRTRPASADQLARLHGDEFAVMLRVQTPEEGQRAVERLLGLLSTPVAIRESQVGAGLALEISASLGATLFPQDEADPETLLRHAGHALYRAKHAGRGGFQFYDPTMHHRDEAGQLALARLQRALDDGELLLHYQPQIDLRSGQIMGVEALLRWQHPERGLLAPAHFLPLIEATGLAVQIGDWVIEQALGQASRWLQAGLKLPVSVNVGARQLRRHDFPQRLQELVQRHPPEVAALLHVDVLEADALAETVATQALIQRCLGLGVGIALDDFGAGYSRLASLKRLPVDTLKLDRSYVQGMLGDAQDLSLVESVIQLARNIGCGVLAKGVESRAHARELLRLGCRLGQGNGIAAAMAPTALPGWMDAFAHADWPAQLNTIPAPSTP